MIHQETLTAYLAVFVAEMAKSGITDVVVSPGSRSTPMALMMAEHPEVKLHVHVDERSAAFFALGMAKTSKRPVALLCTSGTAAANYLPAIVEAYYARVPLIVLTADRPHELRDVGAPQAIDQIHLYGKHVKWFAEMALPEKSEEMLRYSRTMCARAASTAIQSPAGPVHLNFPFREPLVPNLENENLFLLNERPERYVSINRSELSLPDEVFNELAGLLNNQPNGIIVCGQVEDDHFSSAVFALAAKLNYPILADPLSNLRSGNHVSSRIIDTYDTFLRNENAKRYLKPELIIRFGALPVSKALTIFLKENHAAVQLVVDGAGGWRDPSFLATEMVHCNETKFCSQLMPMLSQKSKTEYVEKWESVNLLTKENISIINDHPDCSESRLYYHLANFLPKGATLFVGNSMPIRDVDSFFHCNDKAINVLANRGVNGIDGTVSTALGAAVYAEPLYLIVGDLTFFHDLNGLLAAKMYNLNITIIVINNNGGGIFSFLPQSQHPKHFELLFGTPLDLDYEHAVRMFNGKFTRVDKWDDFVAAMKNPDVNKGLNVIEVMTNREKSLEEHREMWNSVSREISNALAGEIR